MSRRKASGRTLQVPGDKSISHRALILAAFGDGRSRIRGLLRSADIESTATVLRKLRFGVPELAGDTVVVEGDRLYGLRQMVALVGQVPYIPLQCGNSGTTARLMAGVVAGAGVEVILRGDKSLSARPMERIAAPLRAMGAKILLPKHGGLPMTIYFNHKRLTGINWMPDVASAQVKSAILLAGLISDVPVEILEPTPTRDHTERMLRARGVDVRTDGAVVVLNPRSRLDPLDCEIPGDPSSAAFIAGLAALGGAGTGVAVKNVCVNPSRIGAFQALVRMGASLKFESAKERDGEPVATIACAPGALRGIAIGAADVPALIDELPLLACVAARAEGETVVTGAAELRVKESDRIRAVVENLRAIGADAEELPDGFVVRGTDAPLAGTVRTHGDHRIAMAFGVLAALPGNQITIDDPSCVAVSYPNFWDDLQGLR